MEILLLMAIFFAAMFLGVPMAFAMGGAAMFFNWIIGSLPSVVLPQRMFYGLDSFPLMAVPLFILAGEIMNRGGISESILALASGILNRVRAGLAQANILASMLFAGIAGSAAADASGLGAIEIEMMKRDGYPVDYSAAITAASAIIGPIIPPSIVAVVYATSTSNTSVGALFAAGIGPGILLGVSLMVVVYLTSKRMELKSPFERGMRLTRQQLYRSIAALLMPAIILGGIYGGAFTPTEAAGIAVLYSLIICLVFFRTLNLRDLYKILVNAGITTASVFWIVGAAAAFAAIATTHGAAAYLAQVMSQITTSPWMFLLIVNVFLLIIGLFMDTIAAVTVFAPILAPIAMRYGIDPVHFGIVFVVNLCVGMVTPPMGIVLFIVSAITRGLTVEKLVRAIWPFLIALLVSMALITYVPAISLALPRLFGY